MTKPAVFVFCRPYLVGDFRDNVAPLADAYDFHFLTDGQFAGTPDTRARFYARLGKAPQPRSFTDADEADVIQRCRYLRNLEPGLSLSMLRAMASVLEEELDRVRPCAVLSHMVDDYVTHLLAELSRRRGLAYVGYAYSYFPDRIQVTRYGYGEPHRLREPSDTEVQTTLEHISRRTFRQNYLQKDTYTRARHLIAMLRYRVKRVVFTLKGWIENDPLHMHYGCLPYLVERRHWRDFPSSTDFHGDWRAQLARIRGDGERRLMVYFPLGYFPEATIDYWIENERVLDYERTVLDICTTLGKEFHVVVKEHLHMLGARNPAFYRAIRDIPGVISVPPLEFSNDVLGMCDVVLMGAGSIGVESFIRGKPIISFCDRSYWFAAARAAYVDLDDLQEWPGRIRQCVNTYAEPSSGERIEFIRECLRSTMRMSRPGHRWPICEPEDLARALAVGTSDRWDFEPLDVARPAGLVSGQRQG